MEKTEIKYFLSYLIEFFLYVQDEIEFNEEKCQKKEIEEAEESNETEEYVSLTDFFLKTRICTAGTVSKLLSTNKELYEVSAKFENGKYFVRTNALLNYLAIYGSDKMKKRIRNYFMAQEGKIFPKCYC